MFFRKLFFIILCLGTSNMAFATLIMNVTDAGTGQSRFVFSGSATVLSGSPDTANSIWLAPPNLLSGGTGSESIISGGGTVTTSTEGTFNVFDVFTNTFGFSPRVNPQLLFSTNTVISWSGDIIASHDFNNFTSGVFSTNILGGVGSRQAYIIDTQYILTVGQNRQVPEPDLLALFGLGLAGLGWSRRKKA